jgi:sugar transferase (PEP-CTERM/EpsH1 system associated)
MRILVLSPKSIWPLTGGAEIRNFNLLRETAKHHEVYYLSFLFSPSDRENLKGLEPYCRKVVGIDLLRPSWRRLLNMARSCFSTRPFVLYDYWRREMASTLQQIITENRIDVVHVHNLHMGQYAIGNTSAAFVYDTHNLDHVLWDRYSKIQPNPLVRYFARIQCDKFIHWQRLVAEHCAKVVTLSDQECNEYQRIAPDANVVAVPNGADVEYFRPVDTEPEPYSIIYYANFGWAPQDDAALFFHNDILPHIHARYPQARLYFVGKTPPPAIRQLASDHVTVTGYVEDIRDYIARASVVVMPLRVGAGTKHRIFQALAMGKPIVTTSVGAEGIALTHGQTAMITDDPRQFADYTMQLLADDSLRKKLGNNGRQLVLERYDWRAIYPTLEQVFRTAAAKHAGHH